MIFFSGEFKASNGSDDESDDDQDISEKTQNGLSDSDFDLLNFYKKLYEIFITTIRSIYKDEKGLISMKLGLKRFLLKQ